MCTPPRRGSSASRCWLQPPPRARSTASRRRCAPAAAAVLAAALLPRPSAGQNVAEVVEARPDLSTLAELLRTSGLRATLAGTGPFTLFAPTDSAWEALGRGNLAVLRANGADLRGLLQYHILNGVSYNTVQASSNSPIATAQGDRIEVRLSGAGAVVNTDSIITGSDANLAASNGLVHAVSRVLLYSGVPVATTDLWGLVQGHPQLSILAALTTKHGVWSQLSAAGPLTVFAPTDAAFGRLTTQQYQAVDTDAAVFGRMLRYSTVAQYLSRTDLTASAPGRLQTTEQGSELPYVVTAGSVMLGANADVLLGKLGLVVTTTDLRAANGVAHLVDRLLLPEGLLPSQTVYDVVAASPDHSVLAGHLRRSGLDATLRGNGPYTLFAPTDAAFAALPLGSQAVLERKSQALQSVLLYHAVSGSAMTAAALVAAGSVVTMQGASVTAARGATGQLALNSASMASAIDQDATNGIVHFIGGVLDYATSPLPKSAVLGVVSKRPGQLSTFYSLLVGSPALADYSAPGPLTLFAPSDAAFSRLTQQELAQLTSDSAVLARVLRFHLVPQYRSLAELSTTAPGSLPTADSPRMLLYGRLNNGTVTVGGPAGQDAQLVPSQADIPATDGVVHIVDRLLLPADLSLTQRTLWERIVQRSDLRTLAALAVLAGTDEALTRTQQQLTFFAPTDSAFAALAPGILEALRRRPALLQQVLLYHLVSGGALTARQALTASPLSSQQGSVLRVQPGAGQVVMVGGTAPTVEADLPAANGMLHVIGGVLLYPDAPVPTLDIVGVLERDTGRYSFFRTAIATAGMADSLRQPGVNRTVFAPTDDAFLAVPEAQRNALMANATALRLLLSYHILAWYRSDSDLRSTAPGTLTTTGGATLAFSVGTTLGRVRVGGADVLFPDLFATNGVAHGVSALLSPALPPAPTPPPQGSLADVVAARAELTSFNQLLGVAGETGELRTAGPFTVFAFRNTAWASLPSGVSAVLLRDASLALRVVRHSYVQGRYAAAALPSASPLTAVSGEAISAAQGGASVVLTNSAGGSAAAVTVADLPASNGMLHVLDAVLAPAALAVPSLDLYAKAATVPTVNRFRTELVRLGLDGTLRSDRGPLTVFAPSDAAFAALGNSLDSGMLSAALREHIVQGYFSSADLISLAPGQLGTLAGSSLSYTRGGGSTNALNVGSALIVQADVQASNGVLHVVDRLVAGIGTPPPGLVSTYDTIDRRQETSDFATQLRATGAATCSASVCTVNSLTPVCCGPNTIFAPTNAAWNALPFGTKRLLERRVDLLASVVRYHIVPGATLTAAQLPVGSPHATAETGASVFAACCPVVVNNRARLTAPDLVSSDGVVHVIDTVLVPPGLAVPRGDLYQSLLGAPEHFATLAWLADQAGLGPVFAQQEPLTLFAPDNTAFAKLPTSVLRQLAADRAVLESVLRYHAVPQYLSSAELSVATGDIPTLLTSQTLRRFGAASRSPVALQGSSLVIQGGQGTSAAVTQADMLANNGVVHRVDSVLLPSTVTLPTAVPAPSPPTGGGAIGVVVWGATGFGGDASTVAAALQQRPIRAIYGNDRAFAAVPVNSGGVIAWGDTSAGGDASGVPNIGAVVNVTATRYAFAARRTDGSVAAWGNAGYGGERPSAGLGCCVTAVHATSRAFCATRTNGSAITWGAPLYGGDSATVSASLTRITSVSSTSGAFAAITQGGAVVAWGLPEQGGDARSVQTRLAAGVSAVHSTYSAFAAVAPTEVVTWGAQSSGGDSNSVAALLRSSSGRNVTFIASTSAAFAALRTDGSVVAWGSSGAGGDATTVQQRLSGGVRSLHSTREAFAAVLQGGAVVTWGGHGGESANVAALISSGISTVYSTDSAFAAVTAAGAVVTWGSPGYGGDSSAVRARLQSGVMAIASTESAFAARIDSGAVVVWGDQTAGGNGATVAALLGPTSTGPRAVASTLKAFAAYSPTTAVQPICSIEADCSGNAARVTPSASSCSCDCLQGYAGFRCDTCLAGLWLPLCVAPPVMTPAPMTPVPLPSGPVETPFPAPRTPVPTLAPTLCLTWTACFGNAESVRDSAFGGCLCDCRANYAGPRCDRCAPGFVDYPACSPGLWVLVSNDRSCAINAESISPEPGASTDLLPSLAACQQACGERTWCTAVDWHRRSRRCDMYRQSCAAPLEASGGGSSHWRLLPAAAEPTPMPVTPVPDPGGGGCPWVSPTGRDGEYDCVDGTICNLNREGTGCCGLRGGRLRCPIDIPEMCATRTRMCDNDYCCVRTPEDCAPYGGTRPCTGYTAAVCAAAAWGGDARAWDDDQPATATPQDLGQLQAVFANTAAYAAVRLNGSVVTWGAIHAGGDAGVYAPMLRSGVVTIAAADRAFAALRQGGGVVTWGDIGLGQDRKQAAAQLTDGVLAISATANAFAALKQGGRVVTWGHTFYGGDSTSVSALLASDVDRVYGGRSAFAAVKTDGSVVSWGAIYEGGDATGVTGRVADVFSAQSAFAALRTDGSVATWGYPTRGGNSTSVARALSSRVLRVRATLTAFAAQKANGSVVTWGDPTNGGDSSTVAAELRCCVAAVYSTDGAFCAVRLDGTAVVWGNAGQGGRLMSGGASVAASLAAGRVLSVSSTARAFAALMDDGSVVAWGDPGYGGVAPQGIALVQSISANKREFAAVRSDGQVVVWGNSQGQAASGYVSCQNVLSGSPLYLYGNGVKAVATTDAAFAFLVPEPQTPSPPDALPPPPTPAPAGTATARYGPVVTWGDAAAGGRAPAAVAGATRCGHAYSTRRAFAAVRADGSVRTWGDPAYGGDSATVAGLISGGVQSISSTDRAFAALRSDGRVVAWGDAGYGGDLGTAAPRLTTQVQGVYATQLAFAALKEGGSIVTWGDGHYGGDSRAVQAALVSGVSAVYATDQAFAALTPQGVVTWGDAYAGGDSTTVRSRLNDASVQAVYMTYSAFIAVTSTGSAITWGYRERGGDSSTVSSLLAAGVMSVATTDMACAALRRQQGAAAGASVVVWGDAGYGGDSATVASFLTTGIRRVYATRKAFAAVTDQGGVVAWGNESFGGYTGPVAGQLVSVAEVYATDGAFAAVRNDGTVVTWGASGYGGRWSDSAARLNSAGVLYATARAFSVLSRGGAVMSWGAQNWGGNGDPVAQELAGPGHRAVYGTDSAFAALAPCASGARLRSVGAGVCVDALGRLYVDHKGEAPDRAACWETLLAVSPPARGATWWPQAPGVAAGMGGCYVHVDALGGVRLADPGGRGWLDRASFDLSFGSATRDGTGPITTASTSGRSAVMECVAVDDASAPPPTPAPALVPTPMPAPTPRPVQPLSWALLHPAAGCEQNADGLVPDVHRSGVTSLEVCRQLCEARGESCLAIDYHVSGWCNLYSTPCTEALDDRAGAQSWLRVPHASLAATAWGDAGAGGDASTVQAALGAGVAGIVANTAAFAALMTNGAVMAWGAGTTGGAAPPSAASPVPPVVSVSATERAFAALRSDGSLSVWGDPLYGGALPWQYGLATAPARDAAALQTVARDGFVVHVAATGAAFAAVLTNGTVVAWGDPLRGGLTGTEPWPFAASGAVLPAVYAGRSAFAAVLLTGAVRAWGDSAAGGDASGVSISLFRVRRIYAGRNAFCAVRDDGAAVAWGSASGGGDTATVAAQLSSGVQSVAATDSAFAAVKSDGSVVAWGDPAAGGGAPSGLPPARRVVGSSRAFCAISPTGAVACWGDATTGAAAPAEVTTPLVAAAGVRQLTAARLAFAAVRSDGAVVAWGDSAAGGAAPGVLSPAAAGRVSSASYVRAADLAFAAALVGGGAVVWGDPAGGGDATTVSGLLAGTVAQVAAASSAFAALVPSFVASPPPGGTPGGGGVSLLSCPESEWERSKARSCAPTDYVGRTCDSVVLLGGAVLRWSCAQPQNGALVCARCATVQVDPSAPLQPQTPSALPTLGRARRVVACESQQAALPTAQVLSCPAGQGLITVVGAFFGRAGCAGGLCMPQGSSCPSGPVCNVSGAEAAVRAMCDGKEACTVSADPAVLGQPAACPQFNGMLYLEVTYTCRSVICATESTVLWRRNTGQTADMQANLTCPAGSVLAVDAALFGRAACRDHLCYSTQGVNCGATPCAMSGATAAVQRACDNRTSCVLRASADFLYSGQGPAPDPCPGVNKYLEVRYSCQPEVIVARSGGACRDMQGRRYYEHKVAGSSRAECEALLRRHSPPARGATWWPGWGCYVATDAEAPPLQGAALWDALDSRDTCCDDPVLCQDCRDSARTGSGQVGRQAVEEPKLLGALCLVTEAGDLLPGGGAGATLAPVPPPPQLRNGSGRCGDWSLPGGTCVDAVNAYYCADTGKCCCEVGLGFVCNNDTGFCTRTDPLPTPYPVGRTPTPPGPLPNATPFPLIVVPNTFSPPSSSTGATSGAAAADTGSSDDPTSEPWFILMLAAAGLLICCAAGIAYLWGVRSGRDSAPRNTRDPLLASPASHDPGATMATFSAPYQLPPMPQPQPAYQPPDTDPAPFPGSNDRGITSPSSPPDRYTRETVEDFPTPAGVGGAPLARASSGRGRGRGRGLDNPPGPRGVEVGPMRPLGGDNDTPSPGSSSRANPRSASGGGGGPESSPAGLMSQTLPLQSPPPGQQQGSSPGVGSPQSGPSVISVPRQPFQV